MAPMVLSSQHPHPLIHLCPFVPPLIIMSSRSSVQLLSRVRLFVTSWTAACQASLSFSISQSLCKLMSIQSMMPSNHLILCHPLFLLPSIFPNIRVFSSKLVLCIRWPKYWSFSFSISPSNEYSGLISFRMYYHGSYKLRKLKRAWDVSQAQCQSLVEGLKTGSPQAELGCGREVLSGQNIWEK